MVMRRTGRVPLLLLVGLMVAAPAAFASDFVTGVMVGQMLSDDSGSKKVEDTGPESKTVIDYHDGQPVVTKVEAFKSNKWRKLDGPQGGYFVCPGEYRSYSGRLRCRVHDDGLNGFMGGMTDAQELPLQEALTKLEGKPISLQTIEVHGNNLAVKYQLMPAIMIMTAPTVIRTMFDTGAASTKPVEDSGSSFPFFLVAIVPVLIFFAYRAFMNNRSDSEIDELLREARRAERAERPSNEPPSVDELRERQQQNPEREPVVVSSSAPAPKVQKEEPIEVQPGKRKIILD
ncbi:hypothetical protein APR64_22355 [Enterobacter hormaechei]|uniref:Uncharacterized protein n=2 Tax=Enterobacter TaxID=547 RepID=A0A142BQ94_ENTCL|nr:Hypothetical protein [Enterobacter cloacae]AMP35416.1 Hypothetical protein [Enterobacter cloacae]KUH53970.1 hypothetical protein APR64_22355 [Enterobacter hormaechei]